MLRFNPKITCASNLMCSVLKLCIASSGCIPQTLLLPLTLQMLAEKAGDLFEMLNNMESLWEAIATFWDLESDRFMAQGQKMIANETHYVNIKPLLKKVAEKDIPFWTQAQSDYRTYVEVLTSGMSSFSFTTEAKPPPTKEFKFGKLDLILHVPAAVDVKKIMGE